MFNPKQANRQKRKKDLKFKKAEKEKDEEITKKLSLEKKIYGREEQIKDMEKEKIAYKRFEKEQAAKNKEKSKKSLKKEF